MTKPYHKPPTPIDQAQIIPFPLNEYTRWQNKENSTEEIIGRIDKTLRKTIESYLKDIRRHLDNPETFDILLPVLGELASAAREIPNPIVYTGDAACKTKVAALEKKIKSGLEKKLGIGGAI